MMQNQITHLAGGHKRRKRVGRGESSGLGRTSTRGNKGAQSRAGTNIHPMKEGGQMPLFRRLPKRGFSNFHFRQEYQVVNLLDLETAFEAGSTVDVKTLRAMGSMPDDSLIKILGEGELKKKLAVETHAISAKAKAAIESAGGSVTLLPRRDAAAAAKAKRNTKKKERQAKQASGKPGAG